MKVNVELKKVVDRVKVAQSQLQTLLKKQEWMDDARKYAERQGKEVKKLLTADAAKLKTFLEHERKELEKIQKQIPSEVEKLRKFVVGQRKEFEKLLANVRKANGGTSKKKKSSKGKAKKAAAPGATAAPVADSATPAQPQI